ncbi:hypothetical protein [Ktedonospora formicarum]|uniref:Uncharacterized protein n=1 Tax=Ktedonospora formicarum TaxID=2778364 RepID=A0A8J3MZ26_9CHLR|nr:hypothetical protein [Ktedonospora formicarum]GHO51388.1 hypothetical protein KSX_95510 [Ktedonospora formicarum]
MNKETQLSLNTALSGLAYAADKLDMALLGEKRHMSTQQLENGPLATKLTSLAEIVDGASIIDVDAARSDLLYAFSFLKFLQGGFYSALWEILDRAHVCLVDEKLTEQQAQALLGTAGFWLSLDARLGHVHPLVEDEQGLKTYDASFLGMPDEYRTVYYALHEIETRKRHYADMHRV